MCALCGGESNIGGAVGGVDVKCPTPTPSESHASNNPTQEDIGSSPYRSFGDAVAAIQSRRLIAAAHVLTVTVQEAYEALEAAGILRSPSTVTGASAERSFDPAPYLRPASSRNSRTFLAALLIVWFHNDILTGSDVAVAVNDHAATASVVGSTVGAGNGTVSYVRETPIGARPLLPQAITASKRTRDADLHSTARRLLAATFALGDALLKDRAAARAVSYVVQRARLFGLGDVALDLTVETSPFVEPDVAAALASVDVAKSSCDATCTAQDSAAQLHILLSFTTMWARYADAFAVWKSGDGAAIAQGLARAYRVLLVRAKALAAESESTIGVGDAGLVELRNGVALHLSLLRAQVVAALGTAAAATWEQEQIAAAAMESSPRPTNAAPIPAPSALQTRNVISSERSTLPLPVEAASQSAARNAPGNAPQHVVVTSRSTVAGNRTAPGEVSVEQQTMAATAPRMSLFRSVMSNEVCVAYSCGVRL